MENYQIFILILIILLILAIVYIIFASYQMIEGFVAIFNPQNYNLNNINFKGG